MARDNDFVRHTQESHDESAGRRARDVSRDSGYRKAAQLLILIGDEAATGVFAHLDVDEVEAISREIATVGTISDREAASVLQEFGYLAKAGRGTARGGEPKAREMLNLALGTDAADRLLQRVRRRVGPSFQFLGDLDPYQVATILREESTVIIATILSQLDAQQAASVLTCFAEERQVAVAGRIARMTRLSPDALHRIQTALADRVETQERFLTHTIDGSGALRDIMRHMNATVGKRILADINSVDPDLADAIHESLFTLYSVLQLRKRDLQSVLAEVSDKDLALVLKGKDPDMKEALLGAVSSRRRALIETDYEALGAVPRKEVDRATHEFLSDLRRRWEAGEVLLVDGDEEIVG